MFHVSDAGMAVLVFRLLSSLTSSQYLSSLNKACPIILHSVRKLLGLLDDQFIVCPTCHSIFEYSQCFRDKMCREGGSPNVGMSLPKPPLSKTSQCGTLLLGSIQTRTGSIILHPRKVLLSPFTKINCSFV